MRDLEERTPPEDVAIDNPLAFAVFALTRAACGRRDGGAYRRAVHPRVVPFVRFRAHLLSPEG